MARWSRNRWIAAGVAAIVVIAGAGYAAFSVVAGGGPPPVGLMRDERIHTIGLETDAFPEATFTLTDPIAFDAQPTDGETVTAGATGELTLHGVTKSVCVPVQATLDGDTIEVLGSVDVVFADYGMQAPNFGFVTTEDHGTIEFRLDFARS